MSVVTSVRTNNMIFLCDKEKGDMMFKKLKSILGQKDNKHKGLVVLATPLIHSK